MKAYRVLIEDTVTGDRVVAETPVQRAILIARIWSTGHGFRTHRLAPEAYAEETAAVPAPRRGWRQRAPIS